MTSGFSVFESVQSSFGGWSSLLFNTYQQLFRLQAERGGAMKLTTHLNLVLMLRTHGALPPLRQIGQGQFYLCCRIFLTCRILDISFQRGRRWRTYSRTVSPCLCKQAEDTYKCVIKLNEVCVCQGTESLPLPTQFHLPAWRIAWPGLAAWASWWLVGAIQQATALRIGIGLGSVWAAKAPRASTCFHNRELEADGNGEVVRTTLTSGSTSPSHSSIREKRQEISSLESIYTTTKQGDL